MQDPVMRVLTVLEILKERDSVTGAELAERLEVDLRTVQRYLVRLKDLRMVVHSPDELRETLRQLAQRGAAAAGSIGF